MKNQQNTNYAYDKDKKRHYNKVAILWILVTILACALGCIALNHFFSDNIWRKVFAEILLSVITGCVVWILLDFSKSEKEREEYEHTLRDKICDALTMDNTNGILNGYSSEKVKDVLKNCIRYFSKDLADSYADYVSDNLNVLRKDFDYTVTLTEQNGEERLYQDIKYTRLFKPAGPQYQYCMRCLFKLGSGMLDGSLKTDRIFFCEEITNEAFAKQIRMLIRQIKANESGVEELVNLMSLKFKVNDKERKDIIVGDESDESNLLIYVPLSEDDLCDNSGGYLSYKGEFVCEYPNGGDSKFYCIFTNPTLGMTNFKFFYEHSRFAITDVISMLSGCSEKPANNGQFVNFSTGGKSIFPRSGIVVQWTKKTLS